MLRAIEEGRRPADRHPSTGSVRPAAGVGPSASRPQWSPWPSEPACSSPASRGNGCPVRRSQAVSPRTPTAASHRPGRSSAPIPAAALELYTQVKQVDPDNVEATTYAGWLLTLQAASTGNADLVVQAEGLLDDAIRLDPGRADAHCFKAVVRFRFLDDPAAARPAVDRCQALNPPAALATEVAGLAAEIDTALATAASPPPTTTP